MSNIYIISVALPIPIHSSLDYIWDQNSPLPTPGERVKVPLRNKEVIGMVTSISLNKNHLTTQKGLKSIINRVDLDPIIPKNLLSLFIFASSYYHYPLGKIIFSFLPTKIKQGKSLEKTKSKIWEITKLGENALKTQLITNKKHVAYLELLAQNSINDKLLSSHKITKSVLTTLAKKEYIKLNLKDKLYYHPSTKLNQFHQLNKEQQFVFEKIKANLNKYYPVLLMGITGSGKTEVYMHLIKEILSQNKQVLILVPEISLTPQIINRFKSRFNTNIVVINSSITETEKRDAWLDTKSMQASIIIGTRSAIFAPTSNLGIIVVDEEHDPSFKQQDGFRYSARDLAIMLAKINDIPIILGSATPSIETIYNAQTNRYQLLELTNRAGNASLPNFELIDLCHQKLHHGLSSQLLTEITSHLNLGNQVLLFINRRGYAPSILCHNCGFSPTCPHCSIHPTFHHKLNILICHHCETKQKIPSCCPSCKIATLKPIGCGTERIELALKELNKNFPIIRIDRDTTKKRGSLENVLSTINSEIPLIMIGTQLLAKGHHFPNVTLVGILGADHAMYSNDYHAYESLGQTITQVAGRAGREQKKGTVLIQTFNPSNVLLLSLLKNGYFTFAKNLLKERKSVSLPPYSYHILFTASSPKQDLALNTLNDIKKILCLKKNNAIEILGPIPAIIEKKAGKYRLHLLLKSTNRKALHDLLNQYLPLIHKTKKYSQTKWHIDVDPISFL